MLLLRHLLSRRRKQCDSPKGIRPQSQYTSSYKHQVDVTTKEEVRQCKYNLTTEPIPTTLYVY